LTDQRSEAAMNRPIPVSALAALLLALALPAAQAHEDHAKHAAEAPAAAESAVVPLPSPGGKKRDPQAYFTDRTLVDQNGKWLRFYSDVLKGKTVVINTIYTNCGDACPLITDQLVRVRAALGDAFGRDIVFVSLSSDPLRDTPAEMKKFAQKNKADVPGWLWLTGNKGDIDHILQKLGQWSQNVESHATHLIAWNFNTDRGRKMLPNIAPEAIALQLKTLVSGDGLPLPALPQRAN
jgi:protein SCO1/2